MNQLETTALEMLAPEPASQPMVLVKGHALEPNASINNLRTLCGLRLAWGRITEGPLPKCPDCRDELMRQQQAR